MVQAVAVARDAVVRLWAAAVAALLAMAEAVHQRPHRGAGRCRAAGNGCGVCPAGERVPGPWPLDADADVDADADDASVVADAVGASDDDADDAAPAVAATVAAVAAAVAGGVRDVRDDVARVCATVAAVAVGDVAAVQRDCCCCCCCCSDHRFGIRLR